jgi:hypothetical protein
MGITYSVVGIASAIFLFPDSPGLSSIAFTSILFVPVLGNLFHSWEKTDEDVESSAPLNFFSSYSSIIVTYASLFFGIMFSFIFFSIFWPPVATLEVFGEQLSVVGISGMAFLPADFASLFFNNLKVLLFSFLLSLIYGVGGVFILTWNASVWGTVFGIFIRDAISSGQILVAAGEIAYMIPHLILESGSYFLAVVAGVIVSRAVVSQTTFSQKFNVMLKDALILFSISLFFVALGAFIESFLV